MSRACSKHNSNGEIYISGNPIGSDNLWNVTVTHLSVVYLTQTVQG
jgi:hypothetical protein